MPNVQIIAEFKGYKLEHSETSPHFVLRDRAGGPVVHYDSLEGICAEAIDAVDEYRSSRILGAFTIGDIEAMENLVDYLDDYWTGRASVAFHTERAA